MATKLIVYTQDSYPEYLFQLYEEATGETIDISDKYVIFKFREMGEDEVLAVKQCAGVGFDAFGLCKLTMPSDMLDVDEGSYQGELSIARTQATGTITGASQASPGVITDVAHGLSTGDLVLIKDLVGMTELNDKEYTITKLTDDTFSIGVDTTNFTSYVSGGTWEKYTGIQTVDEKIKFKAKGDF